MNLRPRSNNPVASAEKSRRLSSEEIAEARAVAAQSKAEYELKKNGYRSEDIATAQADLDRAKADEIRTDLDFDRYAALAKKDLLSKQQLDTAEANWKVAAAQQQSPGTRLDETPARLPSRGNCLRRSPYHQAQANLKNSSAATVAKTSTSPKQAYAYDEARFREAPVTAPIRRHRRGF